MNLEEILNYRNRCLLCKSKLNFTSLDLAGVRVTRINNDLFVEVGSNDKDYSVRFKGNGTYEKMKKWNDLYVKPLSILKECLHCAPDYPPGHVRANSLKTKKILLKARSVGMTTTLGAMSDFFEIKTTRCAYAFNLFGDSEGNFSCQLNWEDIRFFDDKEFYQVKTEFKDNETHIFHGKFYAAQEEFMTMDIPAFKTNRLWSKEKLIEKIKLYNLFS